MSGLTDGQARRVADWLIGADTGRSSMAIVAFIFKQWGGRTLKANGRLLDGCIHSFVPIPSEV